MNKKLTLLFTGIIIGIIISSSSVTAYAKEFVLKIANYPIIVGGKEYKSKEHPILNLNGTTYVPLRAFTEMMNEEIVWDNGKVIIGKSNNHPKNNEIIPTTFNGMKAVKVDKDIYFSVMDYSVLKNIVIGYDREKEQITYKENGIDIIIPKSEFLTYQSRTYIHSKYFQ